jgi:hypothetical protein
MTDRPPGAVVRTYPALNAAAAAVLLLLVAAVRTLVGLVVIVWRAAEIASATTTLNLPVLSSQRPIRQ